MSTSPVVTQEFLRIPQVAVVIGMSTALVRKVIREKHGPKVHRLGKSPVISRAELQRWMESRVEQ